MSNFIALEESPGCGVNLDLSPEIMQVDFTGKSFLQNTDSESRV